MPKLVQSPRFQKLKLVDLVSAMKSDASAASGANGGATIPTTICSNGVRMFTRDGFFMKTFFYDTAGGPAEGVYGHYLEHTDAIPKVVIVACGGAIWNSDAGRNSILARIFNSELFGVRSDCVRFIAVVGHESKNPKAKEFEIIPDLAEYRRRGNPTTDDGVLTIDLVGGSTVFRTDFDQGRVLSDEETAEALKLAGITTS